MKSPILTMLLTLSLYGCAGGRATITANAIGPPVSFTNYVFTSTGQMRAAKPNEIVQHFKISKTTWTMFYRAITLGQKEWDVSAQLQEKLQQASGNAIVNLTVTADGPSMLVWYFAALVPILPSYVTTSLEGDVARIAETAE